MVQQCSSVALMQITLSRLNINVPGNSELQSNAMQQYNTLSIGNIYHCKAEGNRRLDNNQITQDVPN